jgi:hypothetical protein
MTMETFFNAASAAALAAALVYLIRVYRVLADLRAGREQLAVQAQRFGEAVNQAGRAMAELKSAAAITGESLQARIDRASGLRDELAFLAERADGLAQRLAGATKAPAPSGQGLSEFDARADGTKGPRPAVLRALASVR